MATVLQLSDTHLTAGGALVHGDDPGARLAEVLAAWRCSGRQAHLVVLTGDLADDGSAAACRAVSEQVAALGAPVLAVPGNHDRRETVTEVFGPPGEAAVGSWRVVGVDSVLPGRVEGEIGVDAVLARLDALDRRPTLLAVHHPPRSHSTHSWFQALGGRELLSGLAVRPWVRGILSGHLHEPFDVAQSGLRLLGAPSTLYAIRHSGETWQADASVPVGARLVELGDDSSIDSEVISP